MRRLLLQLRTRLTFTFSTWKMDPTSENVVGTLTSGQINLIRWWLNLMMLHLQLNFLLLPVLLLRLFNGHVHIYIVAVTAQARIYPAIAWQTNQTITRAFAIADTGSGSSATARASPLRTRMNGRAPPLAMCSKWFLGAVCDVPQQSRHLRNIDRACSDSKTNSCPLPPRTSLTKM